MSDTEKDFAIKQLKDTMAKIEGVKNLLNNGKILLAHNKILGIYQKLGYIIGQLEKDESDTNKSD